MTDPRRPFYGIPPIVYTTKAQRDFQRSARAFLAAILLGAAFWAGAIYAAFGATITVTEGGRVLCAYQVAPRYTAPAEAPMPPVRGAK